MTNSIESIAAEHIDKRILALTPAVELGQVMPRVEATPDGRGSYRAAGNGTVFYSDQYGSVVLSKAIMQKWHSDSVAKGKTADGTTIVQAYLGLPIQDSAAIGGMEIAYFERGMIVVRPPNAFVVYGGIYLHYRQLGDVFGLCGRPTSDELPAAGGGRLSRFDNVDIYWSGGSDAFEVHGAIRDKYVALGGPGGFLGYPLSDETVVTHDGHEIGRFNLFQGGSVYWSPATGASEIHGDIREVWLHRFHGPGGVLGFPTSDETSTPSGNARFNNFQNGILLWRGSQAQTFKITKIDLYIDRFESKGSDGFLGGSQDLYVKASAHSSTGAGFSRRFPDKGDMGESHAYQQVVFSIPVRRGDMTVDVVFDGWDSDTTSSDDQLGTVNSHHTIDNLWDVAPGDVNWHGDFRAVYTLKADLDVDQTQVRSQLFWSFHNPTTPTMTKDQFAQTYSDVTQDEHWWAHPFNALFYTAAYKTIGAKGNCFGECLESIYARVGRSVSNEPVFQYGLDAIRLNEINVKHGYQLGGGEIDFFAWNFAIGATRDPAKVFTDSRDAFHRCDFPIISVSNDGIYSKGHALLPYEWDDHDPNRWVIKVANPNIPFNPDPKKNVPDMGAGNIIEIVAPKTADARFNYQHGTNELWSGTRSSGGRMLSIPFHVMNTQPRTPFWEALLALLGVSVIVLGDGGSTDAFDDDRPQRAAANPHVPLGPATTRTAASLTGTGLALVHAAAIEGLVRLPFHNLPAGTDHASTVFVPPGSLHIDPALLSRTAGPPEVYRLDHGLFGRSGATTLHHRVKSAGAYSWGLRSASSSAVATVQGAKSADVISVRRADERANATITMTAGGEGEARRITLDFAGRGGGPRKTMQVKGLSLAAQQKMTASLEAGGEELVIEAGDQPLTLALSAQAGTGGSLEKSGIAIAARQAVRLKPVDWAPDRLHAAPLEVQILDKLGGTMLSKSSM